MERVGNLTQAALSLHKALDPTLLAALVFLPALKSRRFTQS
jgi:hypothetical protein